MMNNLESLKDRIKRIEQVDENILMVERVDGVVMLVRRGYPCPHRTRGGDYAEHLHFHITDSSEVDTPEKLQRRLSWLENGFWSDSMIWDSSQGLKNLVERFLKYRCAGALQNLW
jgi:hypothetical protein